MSNSNGNHRWIATAVAAAAGFMVMLAAATTLHGLPARASVLAGSQKSFCGRPTARDYLKPLARMAPVRQIPRSGRVSFVPRGIRLEPRGAQLVVGKGEVGFGFRDVAVQQVRRLDWQVSTELLKVDSKGRVLATLQSKSRRIGTVQGSRIGDFVLPVSGNPGFFRIDLTIVRAGTHEPFGTFSRYVRLVRSSFDPRLLIRGTTARQGEVIAARLANFGTETISSLSGDWRFSVQRFDGQEWLPAPSDPPSSRHQPIIRKLPAGQMDRCIEFRIPPNEDPGLYRFSMVVSRSATGSQARSVQLTAEFEVTGLALK